MALKFLIGPLYRGARPTGFSETPRLRALGPLRATLLGTFTVEEIEELRASGYL